MKIRKNKTTPKSCQLTVPDGTFGIKPEDKPNAKRDPKGAGWDVGDELTAIVKKGKHGNFIELHRNKDIMAFATASL